jgi:hypothetical protein
MLKTTRSGNLFQAFACYKDKVDLGFKVDLG